METIDKNQYVSIPFFAEKYGLNKTSVYQIRLLETANIDGKHLVRDTVSNRLLFKKLRRGIISDVMDSADSGMSIKEISKEVTCPPHLVESILTGHIN